MRSIVSLALLVVLPVLGCDRKEDLDLTEYVAVDVGTQVVNLHGGAAAMVVKVRNVSPIELKSLRLSVKSAVTEAQISPSQISKLIPGDRGAFRVALKRRGPPGKKRHRLQVTLVAEGLPMPGGVDVLVDSRPPGDRGWIDVGQVKLIRRPKSGASYYYLLAGLPLLLVVGWLLWRISQPKKKPTKKSSSKK